MPTPRYLCIPRGFGKEKRQQQWEKRLREQLARRAEHAQDSGVLQELASVIGRTLSLLWRKQQLEDKISMLHSLYSVKKEMWKKRRWLKTVNTISKNSWGLAVLIFLCDWRSGQGSSCHVYMHMLYHYTCSPVQLRWLWSHLLESELHESCI